MELWARKRPIQDKGNKYEFIFSFNDEQYKYTAIDTLDRNIYQGKTICEKEDNMISFCLGVIIGVFLTCCLIAGKDE